MSIMEKLELFDDAKEHGVREMGLTFHGLLSRTITKEKIKKKKVIKEIAGMEVKSYTYGLVKKERNKRVKRKEHHLYLYASYADRVESPPEFGYLHYPWEYFSKKRKVMKRKRGMEGKGYHVFLRDAKGSANARYVTKRFLSRSPAIIVNSEFHEGFHNYIRFHGIKIPYSFEESAACVVGRYGLVDYAKQSRLLSLEDAVTEKNEREAHTQFIIDKLLQLDNGVDDLPSFYKQCEEESKEWGDDCKVNNAYFLMYQDYDREYPLVLSVFKKLGDLRAFIELIASLPSDYDKARETLEEFLVN